MMQEDRSLNTMILDTVKRNLSRARNNTMTFEEPEPEDGWGAYGAYVVNNLNIPETFDIKKGSETAENTVELSFEVNKNGDPVNIKVEKSLCDKCDKEAIRLIKEGPKWKRKAKKGKRATVSVPFIKTD
jgi:TonB family protein